MDRLCEKSCPDRAIYRIKVRGKLDEKWSHWFNGMALSFGDGVTLFTGIVVDQAELRGILSKIWDLNLQVISVIRIEIREFITRSQQGGE